MGEGNYFDKGDRTATRDYLSFRRACADQKRYPCVSRRCDTEMRYRPNAHATISGNSSRQKAPPCHPFLSFMATSASASRSASALLLAFSRKNGSCVPATRYMRGSGLGIMPGGL